VACAGLLVLAILGTAFCFAQRADYGWNAGIATPHFTSDHPRVLIDEAHHNASKAGFTDRYWPFGWLLRAEGYAVERGKLAFTRKQLEGIRVLALELGKGRVVVLGEAGTATAQAYRRERCGMNAPDNDNRQFVLNVMRWLARAL
jgi:hypothetical protein